MTPEERAAARARINAHRLVAPSTRLIDDLDAALDALDAAYERIAELEAVLDHRRVQVERERVGEGCDSYIRERAVCSCGWRGHWILAMTAAQEPSIDLHIEDVIRRALEGGAS